jgi:nucleoside-diphosphate-sugar epimerase
VEVVYHIAATYREAGQPDSAYRAINVDGTRNLLEAARAGGARRLVHCSTGGVHGHIAHPPANEDAPFNPGDIYQDTKLEAEQLARRFGQETGFDVVVARPIGIYGPGDTRFLKMFRGIARAGSRCSARASRSTTSPTSTTSWRASSCAARCPPRPGAPTSWPARATRRSRNWWRGWRGSWA